MSVNIGNTYISYSNECLNKYIKLTLGSKISKANIQELIKTYNQVRYYQYLPSVSKNINTNINYYLKEKLMDLYPEWSNVKIQEFFNILKSLFYLDNIHEDQIEGIVLILNSLKMSTSEIDYESEMTSLIKASLKRRINFLNEFKSDTFSLNYKRTNNRRVTIVNLNYEIKFPVLYSNFAINKVYNSGIIDEQKLLIAYNLVGVKILKEIINNNFVSRYIIDFPYSIFDKKVKCKHLFNIIDNDAIKEKLIIKMDYLNYALNEDQVVEMLQNGFKLAIVLDSNFSFNKTDVRKLSIFEYVIISDDTKLDALEEIMEKVLIVKE